MAEQANFVQDGMDRVNAAFESIQEEAERLQKQLNTRRKSFEKQLNSSRRTIEKRARKQVNQLRSEVRRNGWVKQAQARQKDAEKRFRSGVDTFLGTFQIASKSDLERIDRKLGQLSRKLKDLETRKKANGATTRT